MTDLPTYLVYLLRLWQVEGEAGPLWRIVLEDPQDGKRRGFADLQSLTTYLAELMAAANDGQTTRVGRMTMTEGDER